MKFPKCSLITVQFTSVPPTYITRLSLGSTEAPFNRWLMFVRGPIPGKQEVEHCQTSRNTYYSLLILFKLCIVVHLNSLIKALKELFVLQR